MAKVQNAMLTVVLAFQQEDDAVVFTALPCTLVNIIILIANNNLLTELNSM